MIYQLIYVSDIVRAKGCDIDSILVDARAFNEQTGVTGALWFNGANFIQILEGERDAVNTVFGRICDASSHENIELCWLSPCESRFFHDWSMAYLSPFKHRPSVDGLRPNIQKPHGMEAHELREFLLQREIDRQANAFASV